jgi:hypothetical protein
MIGHGGPHLLAVLFGVLTSAAFLIAVLVVLAVLAVLVRFLLVATKAAQLYVDKNTVDKNTEVNGDDDKSAPSTPPPASATPAAPPRAPAKPRSAPPTPPQTPAA